MNVTEALKSSSVIAVVGTGAMGAGIAQVAAAAGHVVKLLDNRPEAAAKAVAALASPKPPTARVSPSRTKVLPKASPATLDGGEIRASSPQAVPSQ